MISLPRATVFVSACLLTLACARFKTTDELRDETRSEDAASDARQYIQPCAAPAIDDFGWRADSVGAIRLRLPSVVRSVPNPAYGERIYRFGQGRLELRLAPDAGLRYRQLLQRTPRWQETPCEIAGRPADVATPIQKNSFSVAMRWPDAVANEALVAVVTARTLEELRILRAVLFTLRFP